jgi:hypothetical protein
LRGPKRCGGTAQPRSGEGERSDAHDPASTTMQGALPSSAGPPPACGRRSDEVGAPPACGGERRA